MQLFKGLAGRSCEFDGICVAASEAMELVQEVFSAGNVQPDVVVYNTAISACSESWRMKKRWTVNRVGLLLEEFKELCFGF